MYPSRLASGSSGMTETTLWTNPSPTSSFGTTTAAGVDVTLSQSSRNFDYLCIYARHSTSNSTTRRFIFTLEDIRASTSDKVLAIGFGDGSSTSRARLFYDKSGTTLNFTYGSYRFVSSSQTASTAYIIPTKITGLKI